MTFSIYKISSKTSGKCYVGQTSQGVQERFKQHCEPSSGCTALRNAIQKYGKEDFTVETLIEFDEIEQSALNAIETLMIATLNTVAPNGYNICAEGNNVGSIPKDSESYKRMCENSAKAHKKLWNNYTPEKKAYYLEKMRLQRVGKYWVTPEGEEKKKAARKLLWETDEKFREAQLKKLNEMRVLAHTPEAKAKHSYNTALSNGRYLLTSPDGLQFCTIGLSHLEELYSLDTSSLIKVARNKMSHHKGWKCISLEKEYKQIQRQYLVGYKHYEFTHESKPAFCSYSLPAAAEVIGCNPKALQCAANPTSPMFGKAHQGWSVRDVDLVTDIKPQYLPNATRYELTDPNGISFCIYGMAHIKEQFNLIPEAVVPLTNPTHYRYGKKLRGWSCKKLGITPEEQLLIDNIQIKKEVRKNMNLKMRAAKSSFSNSKKYLVYNESTNHYMCCIGLTHLKELFSLDSSTLIKVMNGKLKQHKGYTCELLTV